MAKEKDVIEEIEEDPQSDWVECEIPDDETTFPYLRVILNGEPYELKKGEIVKVPKGVKEIIDTRKRNQKKIRDAIRERKNGAKGI